MVSKPAVDDRRQVDVDDVALLEDRLVGNAVTDDRVDTDAGRFRDYYELFDRSFGQL